MAAGTDDRNRDFSKKTNEMGPATVKEKPNLSAGDQGESENGNQAKSADNDCDSARETQQTMERDERKAELDRQQNELDEQKVELEDLRKTNTELRKTLREVTDREYDSYAQYSSREAELHKELATVQKSKNQLDFENGKLEKELTNSSGQIKKLQDSEDRLISRVQKIVAAKEQNDKEHQEDSSNNADLRKKLDVANEEIGSRRGTIENLEAQIHVLNSKVLGSNAFEAEAATLKAELIMAKKENDSLKVQMDEYGTEVRHNRPTQREDEVSSTSETEYFSANSSSLEDEMSVWDSDSADAGDRDQEMVHMASQAVDSITEAQGLGVESQPEKTSKDAQNENFQPAASEQNEQLDTEADKASTGGQSVISTSAGDEKPSEKSIRTSPPLQTGDAKMSASDADDEGTEGDSEVSSDSTPPLETPEERNDTNRLKEHLARPIPSPSIAGTDSVGSLKLGLQGSPPTPRMDSTAIDSDPSPLSLKGGHGRFDSFPGWEGPSQGRSSPTLEAGNVAISDNGASQGRSSSVSEAGGVDEVGSTQTSGAPRSDFRFGRAESAALDPTDDDGEGQTTSKSSNAETDESKIADCEQKEDYNIQTRLANGKQENDNAEERTEITVRYSSMAWLTLFLFLALLWWLNPDDKQLWMQANERTRDAVVGLRDERWARPVWLARMSFDGENALKIDRSMFA